jgi:hypothetical protein
MAGRLARGVHHLEALDAIPVAQRARHAVGREVEAQPRIAGPRVTRVDQPGLGLVRGDRDAERRGAARVVGVEVRQRDAGELAGPHAVRGEEGAQPRVRRGAAAAAVDQHRA